MTGDPIGDRDDAPVPAHRPTIRVVVSDDAFLMRSALRHLLSGAPTVTVVGDCGHPEAVPSLIDEQRADVLITDIRMPPEHNDEGIQLAAQLRETHPALGVIVLSSYAEVAYSLKLFESGTDSRAYLLKDRIRDRAQLLDAIEAVAAGRSVIDPRIVEDLILQREADGLPILFEAPVERIEGIEEYYRDYFLGYNTQTRLVGVTPGPEYLHVEVHFTGDFPGGQTGGIFDVTFSGDQISYVRADLVNG